MNGPLAIEARGLIKRFGRVTALDGMSFTVPAGTVFGFLGRNGAGKSVTIRLLAGLSRSDGGEATVAGVPARLNSLEVRSRIGYLPDSPAFYPWMTGVESLVFVGELLGLARREARSRAGELLEVTGISDAGRRRTAGYSAGMRQRLGIAQALMNRPRLLIMDEPAAALDPIGRAEVLELIGRLREQATTVFMSTHLLDDVERVCDHVAIIDRGRLVTQGTVAELRQRHAKPALELEFDQPAPGFAPRVQALPSVTAVEDLSGIGQRFRVLMGAAEARENVLREATRHGATLRRFEVVQPSLEDVFVQLVGGNPKGAAR